MYSLMKKNFVFLLFILYSRSVFMRLTSVFIVSLALQGCAPKEPAEAAPKRTSRNRLQQTSAATSSRTQPSARNGPVPNTATKLGHEPILQERSKIAPVCRSGRTRSPFASNQGLLDKANRLGTNMNRRFTSGALPAIKTNPLKCDVVEELVNGTGIFVIGEAVSSYNFDESNVVPAKLGGKDDLYMLKYRLNCDEGVRGDNENHPLVRNYKAARLIHNLYPNDAGLYLTPAALFISAALPFKAADHPQQIKGIAVDDASLCEGSELRYLVMKAAGLSLASLIKISGPATLTEALAVGLNMVRKLKRLHAHGIIHGDIHWRNVLMSSPEGQGSAYSELVLVDWDYAVIPGLPNSPNSKICTAELWTPSERSDRPISPSFGSDLFRVYDMMALMMGKHYDQRAPEDDLLRAKSQNYIVTHLPQTRQTSEFKPKFRALHDLVMAGVQPTTPEGYQPDLNKAELLLASMIDIAIQISMS
jgi:hypothetical protein